MCVCLREHWQHNKLWIIAKTSRKSEWFASEWRPCAGEGGRAGGMFLYRAACIKLRGKPSLQSRVWVWAWGGFQEEPLGLHQPLHPTDQLWRANSPQLCLFLSLLIHHTVWWLASVLCTSLPLFPFINTLILLLQRLVDSIMNTPSVSLEWLQEGSIVLQTYKVERDYHHLSSDR